MSFTLEIAFEPVIPDNTAFTVLVALQRLGYPELRRVERKQVLALSLDGEPSEAADLIATLQRAEVIFNPNTQRMLVDPAIYGESSTDADGPPVFEALVRDREDDTSRLVSLLAQHFGIAGLRALQRAHAWHLAETDRTSPRERLAWACDMLLCNPVSQASEIRVQPRRMPVREPAAQPTNHAG